MLDEAIKLRQQRKMTLGDALIAATCSVYKLTLATHNTKDFVWIDGLAVLDPLLTITKADSPEADIPHSLIDENGALV